MFPHILLCQCHGQNQKIGILIPVISSLSFVPLKSAMQTKLQSSELLQTCKRGPLLSCLLRNSTCTLSQSPDAQWKEQKAQKGHEGSENGDVKPYSLISKIYKSNWILLRTIKILPLPCLGGWEKSSMSWEEEEVTRRLERSGEKRKKRR